MKIKWITILAFVVAAFGSAGYYVKAAPATTPLQSAAQLPGIDMSAGRALFLKNCAHCHGADARGDEGPDLHKLDASDEWIANRIRKGKAGEMTAFAGKLQESEIQALVTYLRTLK